MTLDIYLFILIVELVLWRRMSSFFKILYLLPMQGDVVTLAKSLERVVQVNNICISCEIHQMNFVVLKTKHHNVLKI